MNASSDRRRRPPRWRRALFQLALGLGALLAIELLLRLSGVAPEPRASDPYVGFASVQRLFVPDQSGQWLETAHERLRHFNAQRFAAHKPPGTLRIFCLGGSTTYGRPYTDSTSFSGWLRALLPVSAPDQPVELINAGGISYASYRVAVVMEELTGYEPDLFVVYSGHNEFLEQRTYGDLRETPQALLTLGSLFRHTALFTGLRRLMGGPTTAPGEHDGRAWLPTEVRPILDGSVGPEAYHRDDAGRKGVLAHFRASLEHMVDLARGAGAKLVLVTPASELADCLPFRSEHTPGLAPEQAAAQDQLLAGIPPGDDTRLPELLSAARLDPRHALTRYLLGEAQLAADRISEAKASLVAARDEDIVPLRAGSGLIAIVREVAAERDVPLLDWVASVDRLAEQETGLPVPGHELFLDHVHMTPDANRELALQLLALFDRQGWIGIDAGFDDDAMAACVAGVESGLDTEAHVRALDRLAAVLDWAGKHGEAAALNERALKLSGGGDAMSLWLQGNRLRADGDLPGAVESYRQAVLTDPSYLEALFNLGEALLQLQQPGDARDAFEQALAIDPGHAPSHFGMGVALEQLGDPAAARNAYRRAIHAQPDMVDAHNRLGISYLIAGDVPHAEQALRQAVTVGPDSARAHHNLGVLLAETGRVGQAIGEFQAALALDASRASSHHKLGLALSILGRNEEGLAELEQALALSPADPRIAEDLEHARVKARFDR